MIRSDAIQGDRSIRPPRAPMTGEHERNMAETRPGQGKGPARIARMRRAAGAGRTGGSSNLKQGRGAEAPGGAYLILASLNSTCLRTTGSYLLKLSFSVLVRGFFLVT